VTEILDPFVGEQAVVLSDLVVHIFGREQMSLTLFGRAVTEWFNPDRDAIRSVVVVPRIDLTLLRRFAEHGPRLGAQRVVAPLMMTPAYITESLDTFALELIEIVQQHVTVIGEDRFSDLTFDDDDVRLQCERELKVLAIGMRQGLLAAGGRTRSLAELEVGTAHNLLRTLRGMLWLKGVTEPIPDEQIVDRIEPFVSRTLDGARKAIAAQAPGGYDGFEALYDDVAHLGAVVNGW